MTLFEKDAVIREVLATDQATSRALNDPVRTAILELLSHRPMSIDDMAEALAAQRIKKAPTTIRHHVDLLKEAGLIDLVRLEEASGGVLKYYAATTRVLDYDIPPELETTLGSAIADTTERLEGVVRELLKKHGKDLEEVAEGMRDCEHCNVQHFKEYLIVRIAQRALAQTLHDEKTQRLLRRRSR